MKEIQKIRSARGLNITPKIAVIEAHDGKMYITNKYSYRKTHGYYTPDEDDLPVNMGPEASQLLETVLTDSWMIDEEVCRKINKYIDNIIGEAEEKEMKRSREF